MTNKELENVDTVALVATLEKLKELVTEIELLVYPVRNIYDEQEQVLPDNYA